MPRLSFSIAGHAIACSLSAARQAPPVRGAIHPDQAGVVRILARDASLPTVGHATAVMDEEAREREGRGVRAEAGTAEEELLGRA